MLAPAYRALQEHPAIDVPGELGCGYIDDSFASRTDHQDSMKKKTLSPILIATTLLVAVSCNKPSASPTPSPAPARRVAISRDSLATLRAGLVAQVMKQIAGRENEPAERVFKNVQLLKGMTAADLVHRMDQDYGVALSMNCTTCHRGAAEGEFASDSANNKRRARFMQQMTNDINQNQLPKLFPTRTPRVDCVTCHRGYAEPLRDQLIPERGKPGGPSVPTPRPGV